jgi:hypothetical protein
MSTINLVAPNLKLAVSDKLGNWAGISIYPGKKAHFAVDGADPWKVFYDSLFYSRAMDFKSQNKDSLIQSAAVLGTIDGAIEVAIKLHSTGDYNQDHRIQRVFQKYISLLGISKSLTHDSLEVTERSEVYIIGQMLMDHNQFPKEQLKLFKELIEKGNWKKVTPITKKQEMEIEEGRQRTLRSIREELGLTRHYSTHL